MLKVLLWRQFRSLLMPVYQTIHWEPFTELGRSIFGLRATVTLQCPLHWGTCKIISLSRNIHLSSILELSCFRSLVCIDPLLKFCRPHFEMVWNSLSIWHCRLLYSFPGVASLLIITLSSYQAHISLKFVEWSRILECWPIAKPINASGFRYVRNPISK